MNEKIFYSKVKWLPAARDLPFKISHYCCQKMKKETVHKYLSEHKAVPILGTMAQESMLRTSSWLRNGCNAFNGMKSKSQPMSFWTEQDVLQYIKMFDLEIAPVYGDIVQCGDKLKCTGCQRTGCIFCGFGAHLEKGEDRRFVKLAETHPRQYEYCIGGGQYIDNPDYVPDAPEYDGEWKNWNPKKIWTPSKSGLGMGVVFDMMNEMYGKDFIKYK